jgi:signal transduction histidine kinase
MNVSVHAEPIAQAGQAGSVKSRYHKRQFAWLTTDDMTENDYLTAWGLYLFAALGCLLVWYLMTRWMWRYLKEPLLVLVAVLLFTPTTVDPVKDALAPAVAITALDLLFKVGNNVWAAVSDLVMSGMFAFGAYLLFVLIRWPIEKNSKARRAQATGQPADGGADDQADDDVYARDDRNPRQPAPPVSSRARVEPRL